MTHQKEVFDVIIEDDKMGNVIESFQVQQYKLVDHLPVMLLNENHENQIFSQSLGNNQRIKIRTTFGNSSASFHADAEEIVQMYLFFLDQ